MVTPLCATLYFSYVTMPVANAILWWLCVSDYMIVAVAFIVVFSIIFLLKKIGDVRNDRFGGY